MAHVPAGGYMPPDAEEAELFELSLFMLEGHLDGILDEERVALTAGDALHIPRGMPFGVENKGSDTVSFVLSFAPPPPNVNLDTMKESALRTGPGGDRSRRRRGCGGPAHLPRIDIMTVGAPGESISGKTAGCRSTFRDETRSVEVDGATLAGTLTSPQHRRTVADDPPSGRDVLGPAGRGCGSEAVPRSSQARHVRDPRPRVGGSGHRLLQVRPERRR